MGIRSESQWTDRRRSRLRVTAVALLGATLLLPAAAPALPVEDCSADTTVCVTYDATFASLRAMDPLAATVEISNTSEGHLTNTAVWAQTLRATLLDPAVSEPLVTRSSQMPNGLIVIGGGACTAPTFADCAGHGDLRVNISGTSGFEDGIHAGTFGIRRVVNVNPPADGAYTHYVATLDFCVSSNNFGSCFVNAQEVVEIVVDAQGVASAINTIEIPARHTGSYQYNSGCCGTWTVEYDATIDALVLAVTGEADTLWNGAAEEPAAQTYRVLSMPRRCGSATSSATLTTADLTNVTASQLRTVTGCPRARFSASPDGFAGDFDASASSTPLDARTLQTYRWNFGDGVRKVTSSPTTRHTYDTPGSHTVTLVVEDSAGARSAALSHVIAGTRTTVNPDKSREAIAAIGAVAPAHDGDDVTVTLAKKRSGEWHNLRSKSVRLSDQSRYRTSFERPAGGACRLRTVFGGDNDHLGSRATAVFDC